MEKEGSLKTTRKRSTRTERGEYWQIRRATKRETGKGERGE